MHVFHLPQRMKVSELTCVSLWDNLHTADQNVVDHKSSLQSGRVQPSQSVPQTRLVSWNHVMTQSFFY